jgi:HK97 family phage major capsid protein
MAGIDLNRTSAGVNLPPALSSEIWGATVYQSAVMAATRRIELPGAGINVPIITGEPEAGWVGETDPKPLSSHTLSNKTITPYTLAVIELFSNQFRRDLPALYRELVRRLPAALGKAFDATVFGTVTAPGSNFDRLDTAPALTVDGTATYADLVAVFQAVAAAGGNLSHWLASPSLQGLLLSATDGFGRPLFLPDATTGNTVGQMLGRPIIGTNGAMMKSTTVGDTTGIAGDFANGAVWGSVEGIQISFSENAVEKSDGTVIAPWSRNMFAVRAEIEVGFRVVDVNRFVRITDGVVDTP